MQDAASATAEQHKQYQCRHIFTDGHRCESPCLRQEEFCYYHHTTRRPVANPKQRRSRRSTFHLPLPEDRSAIQASIGEVLQRIAANDTRKRILVQPADHVRERAERIALGANFRSATNG
jgi:hypothetical protein